MIRSALCITLPLIILASCAQTSPVAPGTSVAARRDQRIAEQPPAPKPAPAATEVATRDPKLSAAPLPTPQEVESALDRAVREAMERREAEARHRRGDTESVFESKAFDRQLQLSYLSETEIEPRVLAEERDLLVAAIDKVQSEDLVGAAASLRAMQGPAASAVVDFTLANVLLQQEQFEGAIRNYQLAIDKFPKFRRAWQQLASARVRLGQFEEALPALTRVVELGGVSGITYGSLGTAYARAENPIAAESAFRMAMMFDPETIEWKLGLAQSYFQQGRFTDAVALFDLLLKEQPERIELWMAQGEAYARSGDMMKAAQNFEVIDRLGGATAATLNNLGDIYANEKLFDLAVDAYVRALEKDPALRPDRALRAARFLGGSGAHDETLALIAGLKKHRGDALSEKDQKDLLRLEARIALARGQGDREAEILEEIIALDPLDGEALILLGQYQNRAGNVEKAIFYFERAASLEDYEADAKVRHAQVLVGQGRYREALPLLKRAQKIKPRENIQEYLDQVERVAQRSGGR